MRGNLTTFRTLTLPLIGLRPVMTDNELIAHMVQTRSILNEKRKPIGYLDVSVLKAKFESGQAKEVCQR
jgi:hypothetical protein